MFTGRWSHEFSVDWSRALDATYPTVAGYLAGRGYATAGFVGNTFYCNARYGLDRGFARYEDYYENQVVSLFEVVRSSGLGRRILQVLGFPISVEGPGTSVRKTAAMLNRDIVRWLADRPRARPFFVFVNYFDAHSPFIPPEGPDPRFGLCALPKPAQIEILKRYQRMLFQGPDPRDGPPETIERAATAFFLDSYESCIAYLDRQVGCLIDELDRHGWLANTLVIVTADHGEHFNERGFRGHGFSLYRRELHVPLLILPPSGPPDRRVVPQPVSLRDLPATVVDLLGLGEMAPFPGRSLVRFWGPGATGVLPPQDPMLAGVGHNTLYPPSPAQPSTLGPVQAIVTEGNLYICNADGREELYDLASDPLETHNLAGEPNSRLAVPHFREALEQLLADPSRRPSAPPGGRAPPHGAPAR
jgi:arylsulfatase A-like enzyme